MRFPHLFACSLLHVWEPPLALLGCSCRSRRPFSVIVPLAEELRVQGSSFTLAVTVMNSMHNGLLKVTELISDQACENWRWGHLSANLMSEITPFSLPTSPSPPLPTTLSECSYASSTLLLFERLENMS